MKLTRRQFLKLFGSSAVGAGVSSLYIPEIAQALEDAASGNPPVIWLSGAGCTGCSVSLLNTVHPKIAEVLLKVISLRFHPTIMAAAGNLATSMLDETRKKYKGKYILILEGAVPLAESGIYCTIGERNGHHLTLLEAVLELAEDAAALVSVGTCASYGGIPRGKPDPIRCRSLAEVTGKTVLNIPGCPPHPDWIVGSLVHVLLFGLPELDKNGRPVMFYGKSIHDNCPNYSYFANGDFAQKLSDDKCLIQLGCKGPTSFADCPNRHWNGYVNWCIGSGTGCIACCEPGFPDTSAPFYVKLPEQLIPTRIV